MHRELHRCLNMSWIRDLRGMERCRRLTKDIPLVCIVRLGLWRNRSLRFEEGKGDGERDSGNMMNG